MSSPLIIRPEAEHDLADAREWYRSQLPGLDDEFLVEIDELFDRIRKTPRLYAEDYKSVRRVAVRRFPYVIYYRITGESVEVLAVLHGSRDPKTWQSRA